MAATAGEAPAIPPDPGLAQGRPGLIGPALLVARGGWEAVDDDLCELLGRPEPELMATPVAAVVNPDDLARERVRLEQLLAGGLLTYQSETRFLHGAGHAIWTLLAGTAVVDAQGTPRCLLQLQDITARKRLELHGTGWPSADVDLDDGPALVAVKDLEGRYLRVNARFQQAFSVAEERLQGRTDEYLFPQSVGAALRAADREATEAAPGPVESEEAVPQADGDRKVVTASSSVAARASRSSSSWRSRSASAAASPGPGSASVDTSMLLAAAGARDDAVRAAEEARARAEAERDGLRRESSARIAELEGERAGERAAREQSETQRDRLHEQAERAATALEAKRRAVAELEAELARVRAASEGPAADLQAEREMRRRAETALEDARRTARHRAAELQAQRDEVARLEAELDRARAEAESRDSVLDATRRSRALLESALGEARDAEREARAELEATRAALAEVEANRDRLREAERAAGERVPLPGLSRRPPRRRCPSRARTRRWRRGAPKARRG